MSALGRNLLVRSQSSLLVRGAVAGLQRVAAALLGLAFGMVAARLVGAEVYGTYVTIMALAGISATALTLGLPTQLGREISVERGGGSEDGVAPLVDGGAWLLAALALATGATALCGATYLALGLGFALLSLAVALVLALYTGAERVVMGGWIGGVLRPFAALVALFAVVRLGMTEATGLFAAQVAAALLAAVVALYLAPRLVGSALFLISSPKVRWTPAHSRYLRTGIILTITQVLIGLTTQIDILIMSAFRPPEEVAHYHAAARAAHFVSMFAGMTAAVSAPTIMRQLSFGDRKAAQTTIHSTVLASLTYTVLALLGVALLGRNYLRLYGLGFEDSYMAMMILGSSYFLFTAFGPVERVLRAMRMDKWVLASIASGVTLNACVSMIVVNSFGANGVATATAFQFLAMGLLMTYGCRTRASLSTDLSAALRARLMS